MKTKHIGLANILNKSHESKWVAFSADKKKILAYSDDLTDLKDKMDKKKIKVLYMKVLPSDTVFAF